MSIMTPSKPDRRRGLSPATRVMNVRLTDAQHHYLVLLGERHDTSASGAIRLLIDESLDSEPRVQSLSDDELAQLPEDVAQDHRESGPTLRQILTWATSIEPDPEWLRRHGDAD